jgi:hypothetical protein
MLSKQIGEEAGQVTGTRVLPDEGAGPKVEMSIQESGTLLGVHVSEMCTFVSVIRPDGTLFAHGQGVATTDDGEMAPWQGQGAGRFTGHGTASSWRGAIYFQTASEKLAQLNGIAVVFKLEIGEDGKTASKFYEWK